MERVTIKFSNVQGMNQTFSSVERVTQQFSSVERVTQKFSSSFTALNVKEILKAVEIVRQYMYLSVSANG